MWPKKNTCKPCSATQQPEKAFFPMVPTCPGEKFSSTAGCITNEGKYYDKLTNDMLLPLSGNDVKAFVCDPTLWSTCQWVAMCYGSNQIAILKISSIQEDHLLLVNACQDGEPIEDNPQPGSKFPTGTVIYPVPPPWCSSVFCNKITAALQDGDCACQGVLDCLQNSEEVCLSSVPEIEEGEELHLFGGTMLTEDGNENDNPSLWKSCIKKLKEIFTGYTGKSICFADLPETTLSPDIIEGSPVSKRQVVLDGFGCLRKGPAVSSGDCDEELDLVATEDDFHTGVETNVDNKKNSNAKAKTFNAIAVCLDGIRRILLPSAPCNTIISRKTADNEKYWEETPMLGRIILFPVQQTLVQGDNLDLLDYAKYNRLAGDCGLHAILSFHNNYGGSSATNATVSVSANGQLLGFSLVVGATQDTITQPNVFVPLTENKIAFSVSNSGAAAGTPVIRHRGYLVGATAQ